jgi:NTE family protein
MRTAFVLAGGGSLGAIQVGMLTELARASVRPDLIVGVSAGALNVAFLAFDPSSTTIERMADIWCRVRTRDVIGLSFGSVLGILGLRGHLADSRGVRQLLERELPYKQFGGARVPLHVVAADQRTGDEVLLSSGELVTAVLASTAIPGVFPAVPRHPIGRAIHAITLLGARQLRQDFAHYKDRARLHLVPPLCPLAQSSYDYSQGAALIAAARESTRRWLDEGGLDRSEFPHELVAHGHR